MTSPDSALTEGLDLPRLNARDLRLTQVGDRPLVASTIIVADARVTLLDEAPEVFGESNAIDLPRRTVEVAKRLRSLLGHATEER